MEKGAQSVGRIESRQARQMRQAGDGWDEVVGKSVTGGKVDQGRDEMGRREGGRIGWTVQGRGGGWESSRRRRRWIGTLSCGSGLEDLERRWVCACSAHGCGCARVGVYLRVFVSVCVCVYVYIYVCV